MAELVAAIAARRGSDPALVDEQGTTTWAELDDRVDRLVHALRARGVQPGDSVALLSGNRREAFEATLACVHGGWVVIPINWHWTAEELAYVVDDGDAVALLADERFGDVAVEAVAAHGERFARCPVRISLGGPIDGFEPLDDALAAAPAGAPDDQRSGGPMFYTSGTTGFPKGVRSSLTQTGEDPSLLGFIAAMFVDMLGLPSDGTTLLEGPMYHSAQWVFSMFPLATGSTVVMRHRFDAAEALELIDEHQVTNLHLVPTQMIRMLKLPDDVRATFDGSSLVVVHHGAAPCPVPVKHDMLSWWGPIITEYYGGTEGGFLTQIDGASWLERPGSLGQQTAMAELLIVREDGTPAPAGESGQIYFRSTTGADFEYHNDAEKTEAAHLEPGVGTLGDVGYLDEEGYLFMSDRKIDMIISGGVNIYPAEIEGVLVTHPAVADAAVFGIPHDEMGEEVRGAVELADGSTPSEALAAELIAHVREHLAGYKAPRQIDFHDAMPRHPTGKLYKRLLRDPFWEDAGRTI